MDVVLTIERKFRFTILRSLNSTNLSPSEQTNTQGVNFVQDPDFLPFVLSRRKVGVIRQNCSESCCERERLFALLTQSVR